MSRDIACRASCALLCAMLAALPAKAQNVPAILAESGDQNRLYWHLLTPEQRDEIANDIVAVAINRNDAVDRDAAGRLRRAQQTDQAMAAIDQFEADDNVGRGEATYNAAVTLLVNGADNIRSTLLRMEEAAHQFAVIQQRQIDLAAANPETNQVQLRRMREMAVQIANARSTLRRDIERITRELDEATAQLQDNRYRIINAIEQGNLGPLRESLTTQQRIIAAQEQILRRSESRLAQYRQTLQQPPVPAPAVRPNPQPMPSDGAVSPLPGSEPSPAPGAALSPAPSPGTRRPVRRGEIPPADPYADFRIPQDLGGTGAARAQQFAQQAAQQAMQPPPPPPALTPEQRAQRTEWLRQQAMRRMREVNAEIDGQPRSGERVDDFEFGDRNSRMIPLQIRPIGGGSGSGGAGLGEQMAGGGMLAVDFFGSEDWEAGGGCCRVSPEEAFRFGDAAAAAAGLIPVAQPDTWQSFEIGGIITVADLVPIYDGYDWWNAPVGSSGRSLSSAGTSLSSAGWSLSSAGNSLSSMGSITPSSAPTHVQVDWSGYNLAGDPFRVSRGGPPEPGSYADMLRQINGPGPSALMTNPYMDAPWATNHRDLAQLLYGPLWSDRPYQIQYDPTGALGRGFGGPEVASLFDTDLDRLLRSLGGEFDYLRLLLASDRGGLDRLLAQPFNVLLTWGPNAFDLDLHMTGPLDVAGQRFHIYYAARGQLEAQPFAQLIRDCICASGSEVILTSALNTQGGVYRVSVFNFGNQSATSTNLADQSQAVLQIVRGGVAVPVGNGTTIQGGTTLLTVTPPAGQPGNTWVAAEIDPRRGSITSPNVIVQSQGSGNVQ
jgi:hypothetical protein